MKSNIFGAALFIALSLPLQAQEQSWARWLMTTVEQHPVMQAYQHELSASDYAAAAAAKPLFNPSLETSIEREGDTNNYQVGLSTDIDWWNVQDSQSRVGELFRQQSVLAVTIATNDLLAKIVTAQTNVALGQQAFELARMQVEQDLALLALTEQQLAAGEISNTELAMAKSLVAQGMVTESERLTDWLTARQTLRALAGERAEKMSINGAFWESGLTELTAAQVMDLPVVRQARLEWLTASAQAQQQQTAAKPVPNIGVGVGRQAGESLLSVNLSMPIQWRNNYSEVVNAASERALASEQRFKAQLLNNREAVRNLAERVQQSRQRLVQWQSLHDNEMTEQIAVLQHRYAQGDLSLVDYQWQVQQLRSGKQAELTLQRNFQLTYIAYLQVTAQLAQQVSSFISSEQ